MSTPSTPPMPGLVVAELHGTLYLHVDGIFAVRDGQVAYYSDPATFDQSLVAQEVARLTRIATLEAELAQLRAVEPPPELAPPARKRVAKAATAVAALPAPAAPPPVVCPHCGRAFPKQHGLSVHMVIAHKPAAPAPVDQVVDDPKAGAQS